MEITDGDDIAEAIQLRAEQWAERWSESVDRSEKVGTRHHTVPKFYLRRFANAAGRLLARDRVTGAPSLRSIDDLAIRDFYTFVADDGGVDGSIEQVLGLMEELAAPLFARLLNPFGAPRPLDMAESAVMAQFLAFQLVRGRRKRREIELMADWTVKTMAGGRLSLKDRQELTAVPHPNQHIQILSTVPKHLAAAMYGRPAVLVVIDRPLFLTCDEPVIVNVEDHVKHTPDCFRTLSQIRRRLKKKGRRRVRHQIVHVYPTRPSGVARAEEIALPLSPRSMVVLGPQGTESEPLLRLEREEADELAAHVNEHLLTYAFDWVASHPEHETFRSMELPPPEPLMAACDGGSVMSEQLKMPPSPRAPQRLSNGWR